MERNEWVIVSGNSMFPLLKDGDILKVTEVEPEEIAVGDIIIYKKFSTHKTVHRVIDIQLFNKRRYFL